MRKTHMYDPPKEKLTRELNDDRWSMLAEITSGSEGVLVFEFEDGDCEHRYPFEYTTSPAEPRTFDSPGYPEELTGWDFSDRQNNYPLFTNFIQHFGWEAIDEEIERAVFAEELSEVF